MDWLTVFASATLGAILNLPLTCVLLYFLYSKWILPSLSEIVVKIKSDIPSLILPIVDEKIHSVIEFFSNKIEEISTTVRQSTTRFQRTVNQAVKSVGLDDLVLMETEEGQEQIKDTLAQSYGIDVAVQAIPKLINAYKALMEKSNSAENSQKEGKVW